MDIISCSEPEWPGEQYSASKCVTKRLLDLLVPAATCLLSLTVTGAGYYHYVRRRRRYGISLESEPTNRTPLLPGRVVAYVPDSRSPNYRVRTSRPMKSLEIVTLAIIVSTDAARLVYHEQYGSAISLSVSVYLLALSLAQCIGHGPAITRLQPHSMALYAVQVVCTAVILPLSFPDHPDRDIMYAYYFLRIWLFVGLFAIHGFAPRIRQQSDLHGDDSAPPPTGAQERASLFSRLGFSWMTGLLLGAFRVGSLDAARLDPLGLAQTSAVVLPAYYESTHKKARDTGRLLWQIFRFLCRDILQQGLWAVVASVAVFIPPLLIKLVLEYLESDKYASLKDLFVAGLFLSVAVAGLAESQCGWKGNRINAKLRAVLLSQIYRKTCKRVAVKPASDEETDGSKPTTTDGTILNMVSGDVDHISVMSGSLYLVWVTFPVQIIIGTYLLYRILGWSGILGVVLMVALLPVNVQLSKRLAAVQGNLLSATDARIQATDELLGAIRPIKYYAWEVPFRERVREKRTAELSKLRSRFVWWSISMTVFYSLPFLSTLITFFLYTVVGHNRLETSVAFPALATFAVLRIPLNRLADSITFLIQAYKSLVRVEQFLQEPEAGQRKQGPSNASPTAVGFDEATLTWPSSDISSPGSFALRRLTIEFRQGGLNVLYGPSGSGKSSVLLALLGEMHLEQGQVIMPVTENPNDRGGTEHMDRLTEPAHTTAYCPHEAWVMNHSIRANILLGLPFNSQRYQKVLEVVALGPDLAVLAEGDQTLAGDGGSRLSGGQKQRVALARALYSPATLVLLDDCLSAVDSRTAHHIFFHAIKGSLMQGRTCILATHHVQLAVPHCEYAVELDNGRVKTQGTADYVLKTAFLEKPPSAEALAVDLSDKGNTTASTEEVRKLLDSDTGAPTTNETAAGNKLNEEKLQGAVSWSVVGYYLNAMGSTWFWILVLCGFALQQFAALGTNFWISEWAFQDSRTAVVNPWYYLAIYAAICAAYAIITFMRDMLTLWGSLRASSKIFEQLLGSVLFAKLAFFSRHPLGQITNRFSRDVGVVDQLLASFSVSALQIAASVATIIGLILWAAGPSSGFMAAILLVLFVAYYAIVILYLGGARNLKRIEAAARSPLYQLVRETLAGRVSIGGYGLYESLLAGEHAAAVDELNRPFLLLAAAKQWLTLRVNVLSGIVLAATGAFVLYSGYGGGGAALDPGVAGLVLMYALSFTENMLWFAQIYAIIQENLTSLERIVEYTETEKEPIETPDQPVGTSTARATNKISSDIPPDWPQRGDVRFKNITARYEPHLEPALKNVTFQVNAGERVAIVGRTGAGKSSLALALLRGLDLDPGSTIEIDGLDISTVPLSRLRGDSITIVPQDDADLSIFGKDTTVRQNLDPLNQHSDSDADIDAVLRSMNYRLDLDAPASDLSRGQRQVASVARGLLRRSKVLVLDEATASVDHAADAAIQAGLRAHVAETGTTVITIAHRLRTIADYDRVVVLDGGRVAEEGRVRELLLEGKKDGERCDGCGKANALFRRLCEESGDLEAILNAAQ
ncbi:ABC bile acid transporter [Apiospora sp. TS-2023a]